MHFNTPLPKNARFTYVLEGVCYNPRAKLHDIFVMGSLHGIGKEVADAFFEELQRDAFSNAHELLDEVASAAQRLWTSLRTMTCVTSAFSQHTQCPQCLRNKHACGVRIVRARSTERGISTTSCRLFCLLRAHAC